jgi:succinylarginine dihydrolase
MGKRNCGRRAVGANPWAANASSISRSANTAKGRVLPSTLFFIPKRASATTLTLRRVG